MEPLGEYVTVCIYVDAKHEENLENKSSHSRILIYVNNALIKLYSNRHNTFESSSFGSEWLASRKATKMVEALRSKLRKFGVNLEGSADSYCEKKSVVTKSSVPASV